MKPPKVGAKNEKQMQPPPPPRKTPAEKKTEPQRQTGSTTTGHQRIGFFLKLSEKKALHNCHKADKVIGLWRCSFIVDLYCKF